MTDATTGANTSVDIIDAKGQKAGSVELPR